jgi:hypothetical protein
VWGYFSVKGGGGIHEFSDSQFGHLFAKGETREAAIRAMVVALRDVRVRGEIHTIIDYAVDMLTSPVGGDYVVCVCVCVCVCMCVCLGVDVVWLGGWLQSWVGGRECDIACCEGLAVGQLL